MIHTELDRAFLGSRYYLQSRVRFPGGGSHPYSRRPRSHALGPESQGFDGERWQPTSGFDHFLFLRGSASSAGGRSSTIDAQRDPSMDAVGESASPAHRGQLQVRGVGGSGDGKEVVAISLDVDQSRCPAVVNIVIGKWNRGS